MNRSLAQNLTLPWGDSTQTIQGLPEITTRFKTLGDVIYSALPFVFSFAGIGLLLMILAAGFNFLTSSGDSKKLEKGKQQLTYAIVGFIVVFAAFWITQLLGTIFGVKEIQSIFK